MTDNIKSLVERLRSSNSYCDAHIYEAADLIEQQAARIAELEAARIAYASEFPADAEGLPDVGSIHANIRAMKAKLTAMEAEFEIPDYAMPPNGQEWALVGSAVAYHLIERHAENWAHAGQLMEAWADARLGAQAGEPIYQARQHSDEEGRWDDVQEATHSACASAPQYYETRVVYAAPVADSAMAKDAERLSWLIVNIRRYRLYESRGYWYCVPVAAQDWQEGHKSAREAIDAAIEKENTHV